MASLNTTLAHTTPEHLDPSNYHADYEANLPVASAEQSQQELSRDVTIKRAATDETDADRGPERLRAGRERSFARRVAAKAVEIAAAPEPDRTTLAGLLGGPAVVVTLTAEVLGAPRGAATRAVSDLDLIAAADPMEAPIKVATLSRDRQRALWNLLASLGVAGSTPPLNEFKQALAAAKAVFAVDAETRKRLAGAVALARRY
jgi:hypothetical protein